MSRKRIALVTTYFPPRPSVASNRMLSFAEYLSDKNDVTVYCLNGHFESTKTPYDVVCIPESTVQKRLQDKTDDGKIIHFLKVGFRVVLSKFLKNPLANWKKEVAGKLVGEHLKKPYDFILSSYAPAEAHEVAFSFLEKYPNVKWIADNRDEMSMNPFISADERSRLIGLERKIDTEATALLTVSGPILMDFQKLCPNVEYLLEVRNGFNHDFKNTVIKSKDSVFRFGYFGTFYGEQKPNFFFEALQSAMDETKFRQIEIHFYGVHRNFSIPETLKPFLQIHDNKPYLEAIENMGMMDLNTLILPVNERKGVYSGKLFDYLSVQRPILACLDKNDVAAELINEMDAGYISDFSNVTEIKQNIIQAIENWKKGDVKMANSEQVKSLHRRSQVLKIQELLDKIEES